MVLKKKSFKFHQYIFAILKLSLFGKGRGPSFVRSRMLCVKFGWNWLTGSGEENENVKGLQQLQQGRTTYKARLSFRLRWAKKDKCIIKQINILNNFQKFVTCNCNFPDKKCTFQKGLYTYDFNLIFADELQNRYYNCAMSHLYVAAHLFAITGWFSFNQDVPVD